MSGEEGFKMGASLLSSESHLIHNLLLCSAPSSFSTFFSKPSLTFPAAAATATAAAFHTTCFLRFEPKRSVFLTRRSSHCFRALARSASVGFSHSFSSTISDLSELDFEEEEEIQDNDASDSEGELQIEDLALGETVVDDSQVGVASDLSPSAQIRSEVKLPSLTVKEKKELASYAHSLGKKLKTQLVGKSGVTSNLASSFIETLEANELLKIKIHRTCPGELEDVVRQLEESTGSVVVGQIGRTIIIYRPSITKMKAEEKRRQAQKIYVRKEPNRVKSILQNKVELPRISNRGRRGSSRV